MLTEKDQLKADLLRISGNDFRVDEEENPLKYLELMIKYIGDPDPELRDNLIYTTLDQWVCNLRYFSKDELLDLLKILIDDNRLFFQIGSENEESVFTRSFSLLGIATVLSEHNENPFIDQEMFLRVKDSLLRYYRSEKDFRGYLEEGGWAHSAAHGADAIANLATCQECDAETHQEILEAIKVVLHNGRYSFCDGEDDRIAEIIHVIYERKLLSYKHLTDWLDSLTVYINWSFNYKKFVAKSNSIHLIRSLYFKAKHNSYSSEYIEFLLSLEKKTNQYIS